MSLLAVCEVTASTNLSMVSSRRLQMNTDLLMRIPHCSNIRATLRLRLLEDISYATSSFLSFIALPALGLPFGGIEFDALHLATAKGSHVFGLQLHNIGEKLFPGSIVFGSKPAFVYLRYDATACGNIQQPFVILPHIFPLGQ